MKQPKTVLKKKSKTEKIGLTPQLKEIKYYQKQHMKVLNQYIEERQAKWVVEAVLNKKETEIRFMKRSLLMVVKETAGIVKSLLENVESNLCPDKKISNELQLNTLMQVLTEIAHSSKNDLLESNSISEFLKNRN